MIIINADTARKQAEEADSIEANLGHIDRLIYEVSRYGGYQVVYRMRDIAHEDAETIVCAVSHAGYETSVKSYVDPVGSEWTTIQISW